MEEKQMLQQELKRAREDIIQLRKENQFLSQLNHNYRDQQENTTWILTAAMGYLENNIRAYEDQKKMRPAKRLRIKTKKEDVVQRKGFMENVCNEMMPVLDSIASTIYM